MIGYFIIFLNLHKIVGGVKEKIVGLFKTSTTEDYQELTHVNNVYRGGKEKNPKNTQGEIKTTIRRQHKQRCKKLFLSFQRKQNN